MSTVTVRFFIQKLNCCCTLVPGVIQSVSGYQWFTSTCYALTTSTIAIRSLSSSRCWLKNKGSRRTLPDCGSSPLVSDLDLDFEDSGDDPLELAVKEEIRAERRRQKAILFHRMRREFEPRGSPERTLTWQEIKQIRFLKQELPEEWTVPRLAEGFNVSLDVIHRILKSTFVPVDERQKKQDSRVKAAAVSKDPKLVTIGSAHRKQLPPGTQQLSASQTAIIIREKHKELSKVDFCKEKQVGLNVSSVTSALQQTTVVGQTMKTGISASLVDSGVKRQQSKMQEGSSMTDRFLDEFVDPQNGESVDEIENEEVWDGLVLSEEELERLAERGVGVKNEVVQKGNEFYDSSGTFLYRI